jgi:dTMP kinase
VFYLANLEGTCHNLVMERKPAYIVLEGPDGCGKTSQMRLLQQKFTEANEPYVAIREPGATGIGKQIREILLTGHADKLDAISEVLLFSADRHHTLKTLTQPEMANGMHILSDRCYLTTMTFQGYGRGLSLTVLEDLTEFAMEGVKPDLIIILDVSPEISLARKDVQLESEKSRSTSLENRFESIGHAFHSRIREGYLKEAERHADFMTVVDATQSIEAVHREIVTIINQRLGFSLPVA